jgi:Mycoplasma protein of unknown function, DUF285
LYLNFGHSNVFGLYDIQFMHAVRFNADISTWNTSSLTNASEAFFGAISFNGDVSAWDVRKVADLTKMVSSIFFSEIFVLTANEVLISFSHIFM